MFKLNSSKGIGDIVRQIISPIKYEVRVLESNWSSYFGHYENQKWGQWDSNSCWALSGINCIEDQLEWLYKNNMFGTDAMSFFTQNDYIDSDGDFSLSERFIEILSGVHDNGNNQIELGRLVQVYGCIPRSLLTYTLEKAQKYLTKEAFNADYFDKSEITTEMYNLGQQFLKYVNISRQWIGKQYQTPQKEVLLAALKQAPLQIGIPVPRTVQNWNNPVVRYDGGTNADHAVELYGIDANCNYLIFDQYLPNLKVLSSDYYLPFVTQVIVNAVPQAVPNPIPQPQTNNWWSWLFNFFNGIMGKVSPA